MIDLEFIQPDQELDPQAALQALIGQLEQIAEGAKELFEKTVATWDEEVEFSIEVAESGDKILFTISTDSDLWQLVDSGSPPHIIEGDPLIFNEVYRPKTQPGVLNSTTGGSSGGLIAARVVEHPGFEGRDFTGEVLEWIGKELGKLDAKRIASASNWSG